jgi:hypothetical protein
MEQRLALEPQRSRNRFFPLAEASWGLSRKSDSESLPVAGRGKPDRWLPSGQSNPKMEPFLKNK